MTVHQNEVSLREYTERIFAEHMEWHKLQANSLILADKVLDSRLEAMTQSREHTKEILIARLAEQEKHLRILESRGAKIEGGIIVGWVGISTCISIIVAIISKFLV